MGRAANRPTEGISGDTPLLISYFAEGALEETRQEFGYEQTECALERVAFLPTRRFYSRKTLQGFSEKR